MRPGTRHCLSHWLTAFLWLPRGFFCLFPKYDHNHPPWGEARDLASICLFIQKEGKNPHPRVRKGHVLACPLPLMQWLPCIATPLCVPVILKVLARKMKLLIQPFPCKELTSSPQRGGLGHFLKKQTSVIQSYTITSMPNSFFKFPCEYSLTSCLRGYFYLLFTNI